MPGMFRFFYVAAALTSLAHGAGSHPVTVERMASSASEFRLANGMRFLIAERHSLPTVSFEMRVAAGIADFRAEEAGIGQSIEAVYWNGSESLGVKNPAGEKAALAETEAAIDALMKARRDESSSAFITQKQAEVRLKQSVEQLLQHSHLGFFRTVFENNGVTGASARVSADASVFTATLPSERAELWFKMHGDWLNRPSMRFLYSSRIDVWNAMTQSLDVSTRVRVEDQIAQRIFAGRPYSRSRSGEVDWGMNRASQVSAFLANHFTPANTVVAIVGDITAADARRWAEAHFGKIAPRAAKPATPETPPDSKGGAPPASRNLGVLAADRFNVAIGWDRPPRDKKNRMSWDVLSALLGGGSRSLLHRELVTERQLAASVNAVASWPGHRLPSLFLLSIAPLRPGTGTAIVAAVGSVIESLRQNGPAEEDLTAAKRTLRAGLAREFSTNPGAASLLARLSGDFAAREEMAALDTEIDAVTSADLKALAASFLTEAGRWTLESAAGGAR